VVQIPQIVVSKINAAILRELSAVVNKKIYNIFLQSKDHVEISKIIGLPNIPVTKQH